MQNGIYTIFFYKQDVIQAIQEIDKHFHSDHSALIKGISDGSIKQVNLLSSSKSDQPIIELLNSDLACYLLLKGKMTILKNNSQLKEITIDESPPEAELDGIVRNIFWFREVGSNNLIYNGKIRPAIK